MNLPGADAPIRIFFDPIKENSREIVRSIDHPIESPDTKQWTID